MREDVDPVITKATYVLFFRRVTDTPRTLANLMLGDPRCQEGSSWLQEPEHDESEGGGAAGGRASESE